MLQTTERYLPSHRRPREPARIGATLGVSVRNEAFFTVPIPAKFRKLGPEAPTPPYVAGTHSAGPDTALLRAVRIRV